MIANYTDVFLFIAKELEGKGQPKNDKAGNTLFGITEKYYPMYYEELLRNPTDKNILGIYSRLYEDYEADKLYYPLNLHFFDSCLNINPYESTKLLQQSVNELMPNALVVDGIIGHETITHVNTAKHIGLTDVFIMNRLWFYTHNPQKDFRCGWCNRVIRLTKYIKKLENAK